MVQRCFLGLHCALGPHPENFPLRLVCMSSRMEHTIVWLSKQRDNLAPAHPSQLWVLRTTPVCGCHTPVCEPSGIGVTLWSKTTERTTPDGYGACQQCLQTRALQQWLWRPCGQLHTFGKHLFLMAAVLVSLPLPASLFTLTKALKGARLICIVRQGSHSIRNLNPLVMLHPQSEEHNECMHA